MGKLIGRVTMGEEVWTPDGKAHAWVVHRAWEQGGSELHYENQAAGKRWSVKVDLEHYYLHELAISDDGRFVVIWTGYHMRRLDSEEFLDAYDEDGKCVYHIMPQQGTSFREATTQEIAALLASGDPEGELLRFKEDCERPWRD